MKDFECTSLLLYHPNYWASPLIQTQVPAIIAISCETLYFHQERALHEKTIVSSLTKSVTNIGNISTLKNKLFSEIFRNISPIEEKDFGIHSFSFEFSP